jgi:hypothetical protein
LKIGFEFMSVEAPDPISNHRPPRRARAYHPPSKSYSHGFSDLLVRVGRVLKQERKTSSHRDAVVFYAGNLGILKNRAVSVVGSRDVTRDGRRRAAEVARDLAMAGVTVVSGLAKGRRYDRVDERDLQRRPGNRRDRHLARQSLSSRKCDVATEDICGSPFDDAFPGRQARPPIQFAGSQQYNDGDHRRDGDHRSIGRVRRVASSCGVRSARPIAFHHKFGGPGSRTVLAEEISWATQG